MAGSPIVTRNDISEASAVIIPFFIGGFPVIVVDDIFQGDERSPTLRYKMFARNISNTAYVTPWISYTAPDWSGIGAGEPVTNVRAILLNPYKLF
jgi:hypothetical protein